MLTCHLLNNYEAHNLRDILHITFSFLFLSKLNTKKQLPFSFKVFLFFSSHYFFILMYLGPQIQILFSFDEFASTMFKSIP